MRGKLTLALLILVVAMVALTAPAHAKGPSSGTIEGEGLDAPIATGFGNGLLEDVGFFEWAFAEEPSSIVALAPTDDLGPKLTIRWVMPGPGGVGGEIMQDLYPYADGGPVVFTAAGQSSFETQRTRSGWFRAPQRLLTTLAALGVPDADELTASGGGRDTDWSPLGATLAAVLLLGAAFAVLSRRRGEAAPAAG